MKMSEYDQLPAGQRVRLRVTGFGARDRHVADEIIVARVTNHNRYEPNRWGKITFEGMTLPGSESSFGEYRLVVVEKHLLVHEATPDDGVPPLDTPRLTLVRGRDIIGVWDDQVEQAELADRRARFAERDAANRRAQEREAARRAELQETVQRLHPVLERAGVQTPSPKTHFMSLNSALFSLTDMAKVIDLLTGETASSGTEQR